MFEGVLTGLLLLRLFFHWLTLVPLSAGDWLYYYIDSLRTLPIFYVWSTMHDGLGSTIAHSMWVESYFALTSSLSARIGLSWGIIERIFWFFPYIIISFFSSYGLLRYIGVSYWARLIGAVVYISNTYALILVSGGQMGVALAYAVAPMVWNIYMRLLNDVLACKRTFRIYIWPIIIFFFIILFDLRIAYITAGALVLYICFVLTDKMRINNVSLVTAIGILCKVIGFPILINVFLHAYWILPLVTFPVSFWDTLSKVYTSEEALRFFSFADFSHALSLLHPNWPENIFGKIYFMQPEFIGIPILAFIALFKKDTRMVFFILLGVIGAFLAKGVHDPFGFIYSWMFDYIPGFVMFRDPTKFYALIALSYSMLIPFTLSIGSIWILKRVHKMKGRIEYNVLTRVIFILFLCFWVVLHRQAYNGSLAGTFHTSIPEKEYATLAAYFENDPLSSKVLWIPQRSRYGYFSLDKPSLSLESLGVASISSFLSWIPEEQHIELLKRFGISHIVVPTDPKEELFLKDRKYDNSARNSVISVLQKLGFEKIGEVSDIAVFKIKNYYNLFFYESALLESIQYKRINPTLFTITIQAFPIERRMIYSQRFDPYWVAHIGSITIYPNKTVDGLQEYIVPPTSGGIMTLLYRPQNKVFFGLWISCVTVFLIIGFSLYDNISLWKKK